MHLDQPHVLINIGSNRAEHTLIGALMVTWRERVSTARLGGCRSVEILRDRYVSPVKPTILFRYPQNKVLADFFLISV